MDGIPPIGMLNLEYRFLNEKYLSVFKDIEFDFVFSNSVIEHLKTIERQRLFATEVQCIGRGYAIQTPNKFFFIEPQFMFPYANQLPFFMKKLLHRYWPLRPFGIEHLYIAEELRPLSVTDMSRFFPRALLLKKSCLE